MLIGYMRVSKADGSQVLDLQRDALIAAGVKPSRLYQDQASGKKDDRPGLEACLKSLREGDMLIVWKLDRLGRNLRHLVNTIHDLIEREIGFQVLSGQRANIDTPTAGGRLVFGIFAALAERARGRKGGRPYTMTSAKLRLSQAAMANRDRRDRSEAFHLGLGGRPRHRHRRCCTDEPRSEPTAECNPRLPRSWRRTRHAWPRQCLEADERAVESSGVRRVVQVL